MPTVILMRCGPWLRRGTSDPWHRTAPLTPRGIEAVQEAAAAHLDGRAVSLAASSALRRGRETLAAALPEFPARETSLGLTPSETTALLRAVGARRFDVASAIHQDGAALRREAARVAGSIRGLASRLSADGCALLVTHAPLCDLAVAHLEEYWPPVRTLAPCHAYVLSFGAACALRSVSTIAPHHA